MFESLIWLVPAAVFAAGLWRPRAGLLALVACLPLFGAPPGGPYLAALDLAVLTALVTAWRVGPAPRSRLDRSVLVFVAISLASMVPLVYSPPSWQPRILLDLLRVLPNVQSWSELHSWRAAANLILGWLLYLTVRRAFHGRSLRPLGLALAAGLVPTLLLGFVARAGLVDLWAYRPLGGPLWDSRLHSLFFHSGWLAEYLVLAAPVAVAALLDTKARHRAAALLLAALALLGLVLTLQRGGWLTALAQISLLALFEGDALLRDRRRLGRAAVATGAVLLLALLAVTARPALVQPLRERLQIDESIRGRWAMWRDSLAMLEERPGLGWGLGSFLPAHTARDPEPGGAMPLWLTPHNQYLMIGAERGLLGLLGLGFLAWGLARCLRTGLRSREPEKRRLARGLTVALVGFAVYGLVQYLFFLKMLEWLFWILVGSAAALDPEAPSRRATRASSRLVAAILLLLLLAWRGLWTPSLTTPSDRSFGFHFPESSGEREFSWTEARAALRLPWEGEVLSLELANGHPRAGERPLFVTIRLDGRVLERLTLLGGWEEHRFVLGAPQRESVVLSLEVEPAFRPYSDFLLYPGLERSHDIRLLGVAVGAIRWSPAEPAAAKAAGPGPGRASPVPR